MSIPPSALALLPLAVKNLDVIRAERYISGEFTVCPSLFPSGCSDVPDSFCVSDPRL
jgi:hypothetical protein